VKTSFGQHHQELVLRAHVDRLSDQQRNVIAPESNASFL
jgi:hypothetical protein